MVAQRNNAICSICGKPYHKCLSCRDTMNLQPWKVFTDTSEHYKVFQAVRGYNIGVYTKDEFKSKLKNIDLSDLETYKESIKVLIKDALEKENKEELVVDDVVITTPVSRKRNYKTNKVETNMNVDDNGIAQVEAE